ncbi:MAG: phosphomannomutase/phosphoglucomutase [Candidatus Aminicenantes bacterium]|nr:phosphomannomutase/phosphoglucomutase [Candidatus Aminicenantes bacterium]
MDINPKIFREYDIRGIVGQDLDETVVEILGRAMGTFFLGRGQKDVAVGRDCRLSSPGFGAALIRGLLATGCDVADLGVVPTPLLYFSVFFKKKEAGVMITGSHNPPEHNGFKMMSGEDTLYGKTIQALYEIVRKGVFPRGEGRVTSLDVVSEYQDYVARNVRFSRPVKVVIDAGNGTGGVVAVPLFRRMGAEVVDMFCEPDGHFPNHHPDPTLPEAMEKLIAKVRESGAELGIGYDGDADRIGVVDDEGRILWGDQLLILFARDILPSRPGAAVISEVKASKVLYEEIERLGGRPIMWRTGHSLIKQKIKEEKAPLAGEMSGHIFFGDRWFGFDDAIYASARLLEILSRAKTKLSAMMSDLPKTYSTPEIRIYASDEVKFKIVEEVRRELAARYPVIDIDGVRAIFPKGWGLVRASNTQAVIVLRFEADTEADLAAIQKEIRGVLQKVINTLGAS